MCTCQLLKARLDEHSSGSKLQSDETFFACRCRLRPCNKPAAVDKVREPPELNPSPVQILPSEETEQRFKFVVQIGSFPVSNQSTDFSNSWLIANRTAAPGFFAPRSSAER